MNTKDNVLTGKKRDASELVMQSGLQLLPLIMNNIPQAVFWKDRNLIYLGCNQAFADDAGFSSPAEIVGKTDFDMPWKEQAELYRADDQVVMENAIPKLNYEEPQSTPDGSTIWLSTSKIPVFENGRVVAVLGMYEDITARKSAEQAVRASEERFRTVADYAYDWEYWLASDGTFTYISPSCERISGYEPEEFTKNPQLLSSLIHTEDHEAWDEHIRRYHSEQSDEAGQLEFRITTRGGETRWIGHSCQAVHDGANKWQGRRASNRDITERKHMENMLNESEERYRRLSEATVEGVVIHDKGILLDSNDVFASMFGYERSEVIGMPAVEFLTPETREITAQNIRSGYEKPYEVMGLRKDGSTFPVEITGKSVPYQGRNVRVTALRDITEHKQMEQELKEEQQRLQTILETINIPVIISRLSDSKVMYANDALAAIGNIDLNVLIGGRTVDYFANAEDRNKVAEQLRQKGHVGDFETQLIRGDGTLYWALLSARLVNYQNDLCVFTSYTDITARKLMEEEVKKAFERRGQQVQLSTQVSQSIAAASSLEELYQRVVTQVKEQFGYYHTQLLRYDPAQDAVVLIKGYGETGTKMLSAGHRMPMGAGLIGTAAATGETLLRPNLENDPDWHANPLLPETKGEIAVPIKLGDQVLGVLDVQSSIANALGPDDQLLLEGLCGQIATAVESTRLQQQMAERLEEINRLYRAMSHEGWQSFREKSDLPAGFVFDQGGLRPATEIGLAEELFAQVPLTAPGGEVIGTLAIADDPQRPISPDEQEFVNQVSEQVALALESARLFEQTQSALATTQESEAKLAEALNIARLGNWEYDFDNDLFTFNDQFYSIFHTSAEKVGGYRISSAQYAQHFVHPDDAALVGEEIGRAIASTDRHFSANLEHRILYEDGGIGYISVDIHLERDENGKIVRWYGANQDITERKKAELIIQENEARLAEALNIARLANWEYDYENDQFIFNDQFYSIFHTTAEKVGGYRLSSAQYAQHFVHPDDAALVGEEIGKAVASTDQHFSARLEHRVLYEDGGIGYISVDVHLERDENGKIIRWYGANQDITERKKAELVIQENEARLAEALNIARLANWEYDVENDLFTFNDNFYSIFHATVEQVGKYQLSSAEYAQRFVYPEDMPIVGSEIEKALASTDRHYSTKLEHRVLFADGGVGYISVDIHIDRDENGKIVRYYGANQDITERKKAEEVVRLAQERAQIILETVTLPMVITRISDNVLTFINQPATEVAGVKYEEAINRPAPDFYYNLEDRNKFIAELRANGRVFDLVVQLKRGAEPFWALLSARIFHYQNEPSILTTFMDITDRVNAEEAVARRASELQTVAEVSTTTATTLEPDYLLQSVVDLTKERFGLYHAHIYLADDAWQTLLLAAGAGEVGRQMVADNWNIPLDHPSSIVAEAARNRKSVIANDVYRDQESGFLSNRLLPDTRSEMAVPMIVGDKVLGVFDVQSDVADRFTQEDANIYTTLASQVGVALQNARLYVEQAATVTQLRELDRLKSSFLANMSHELRTPLNSILGFADVMLEELDGPLTDYMNNDLRLIQKNGQHLLHLINDVLDMAKIEAGRMNLNPEKFHVYEVLDEVISITSTLASEKNLSLYLDDASDQEAEIFADRTRLRQVMINLVNNSIKFTETGKIAVKVSPMEGARVLISVKDTGIGIPPDKLEAVFLEFTQVDTSSTRKVGGTGLGLPISRRLVEMHGGRLWAESTGVNGEGSTFYVELPLEARITEVIEKQAK